MTVASSSRDLSLPVVDLLTRCTPRFDLLNEKPTLAAVRGELRLVQRGRLDYSGEVVG